MAAQPQGTFVTRLKEFEVMPTRLTGGAFRVPAMAALITGLVLTGEGQAQTPKPNNKKAAQELKKVVNQEIKGREAEYLNMVFAAGTDARRA